MKKVSSLPWWFISMLYKQHYNSSYGLTGKKPATNLGTNLLVLITTVHSVSLITGNKTNNTTNYLTASRCLQASFRNNSGSVPKVILTMVNVLYSAQFTDLNLIRCTQFIVQKCSLQLYYHSSATDNMIQSWNKYHTPFKVRASAGSTSQNNRCCCIK